MCHGIYMVAYCSYSLHYVEECHPCWKIQLDDWSKLVIDLAYLSRQTILNQEQSQSYQLKMAKLVFGIWWMISQLITSCSQQPCFKTQLLDFPPAMVYNYECQHHTMFKTHSRPTIEFSVNFIHGHFHLYIMQMWETGNTSSCEEVSYSP